MSILAHEKTIEEYEKAIAEVKKRSEENTLFSPEELEQLEMKVQTLKNKVYENLSPWERVAISRHPRRPHGIDFVRGMLESFEEIHGDRLFRDDPSIITGLGMLDGIRCVVIAQEKGSDTETRLHRNFGMPHPEGYRKALRAMQLAEKFSLPVVCLIDTPGAYPGLTAEERGQGWAIAKNLFEMSQLKTPIVVLVIGEGCSGGALAIGIGDHIAMLENSYYSVISPEGCASILWKDRAKNETAAAALKMLPENLLEMKVIDEVLPEPLGGAHHNPAKVIETAKNHLSHQLRKLAQFPIDELLQQRYQKFRELGAHHTTSDATHCGCACDRS